MGDQLGPWGPQVRLLPLAASPSTASWAVWGWERSLNSRDNVGVWVAALGPLFPFINLVSSTHLSGHFPCLLHGPRQVPPSGVLTPTPPVSPSWGLWGRGPWGAKAPWAQRPLLAALSSGVCQSQKLKGRSGGMDTFNWLHLRQHWENILFYFPLKSGRGPRLPLQFSAGCPHIGRQEF